MIINFSHYIKGTILKLTDGTREVIVVIFPLTVKVESRNVAAFNITTARFMLEEFNLSDTTVITIEKGGLKDEYKT